MATAESKAAPDPKLHPLTGDLCVFKLGGDIPERKWFTVNTTYGVARKIFKVEPYNPALNKGVQRPRIDSHVRTLKKATKAGEYTPAPWSAHVLDSHLKHLEINDKTGRVKLNVNERVPLSLTDGGHRRETLEDMRADAIKAGDKEMMALIDALNITVVIYLDPKFWRRDFRHLQEGLRVNKSQTNFMRQADGDVDPKRRPFVNIASKAAIALNLSEKSFLKDQIKFASGELAPVEYASITAYGGSDLATSLYGGAKIVWHDRFRPLIPDENAAAKFLVECQDNAFQAIFKYGAKAALVNELDGTTTEVPEVLMTGRILRPTKMKGPKTGTTLLIMLGNMLAYRLLSIEKRTEPTPNDLKKLIEAVTEVLDIEMYGGGSGTVKREVTNKFVHEYFSDVVRGAEDEHDKKKVDAVDGIPIELCDVILTRSTLDVEKDAREFLAREDGKKTSRRKRTPEEQTDPAWTEDDAAVVEDDNSTAPDLVPDFSPPEEDNGEEFTPPPSGKPVKVSPKNKAIVGMG